VPAALARDQLHVAVVTRLNVYLFRERALEDRASLNRRLDLLESTTVPSIRWQTTPPDEWIILIDESTHPEDRARIASMTSGLPARVVTLPSVYDASEFFRTAADFLRSSRPWLMTCRLDSDDALGRDFLRTLCREAEETDGEFLNVAAGLKLTGRQLTRLHDGSSPFLAFVEPRSDGPRTVYCTMHQVAAETAPVRQVRSSALWMMRIHEANMESVQSGRRTSRLRVRRQFPFRWPTLLAES
jgi:hypothetical protein